MRTTTALNDNVKNKMDSATVALEVPIPVSNTAFRGYLIYMPQGTKEGQDRRSDQMFSLPTLARDQ